MVVEEEEEGEEEEGEEGGRRTNRRKVYCGGRKKDEIGLGGESARASERESETYTRMKAGWKKAGVFVCSFSMGG